MQLRGQALVLSTPLEPGDKEHNVISAFQLSPEDSHIRVVGAHTVRGHKFVCDAPEAQGTIDADHLIRCFHSFEDGSAPRIYSSLPAPTEPIDAVDGVAVVVGSTLDIIAKDPTKDVLLEIYAPWCSACQAFSSTYRRLAVAFRGVSSVVIAKMDGTENEHPDIDLEVNPKL